MLAETLSRKNTELSFFTAMTDQHSDVVPKELVAQYLIDQEEELRLKKEEIERKLELLNGQIAELKEVLDDSSEDKDIKTIYDDAEAAYEKLTDQDNHHSGCNLNYF